MRSADLLDVAFNAHVHFKLNAGMDFISVILTEMKYVNTSCPSFFFLYDISLSINNMKSKMFFQTAEY